MDKKHCIGCRNNFYNGNNDIGVKECWYLKDAKIITRYEIGYHTPTYKENFRKVKKPNCYSRVGTYYMNNIGGFKNRSASTTS